MLCASRASGFIGNCCLDRREREFLIQRCAAHKQSVFRWLRVFKVKADNSEDALIAYYKISAEQAKVWYQNRDNDTLKKEEADRSMLLKKFSQPDHKKLNPRKIAEIVSESHPKYSGQMGEKICRQWVQDKNVKEKNITEVCITYGFERRECETLLETYYASSLSTRNVDKALLSQAACTVFDTLYGDSKKEVSRCDAISQYLATHNNGITESQLIEMCSKFKNFVKDEHSPEEIAKSLMQGIDDVRRWIQGFDNMRQMKKDKLDRKIKLFEHLWRDAEPRFMSRVAIELGEAVPMAQNAYTQLRSLFDDDTPLSEISKRRKIPVESLERWKRNYLLQKSTSQ